MTRKAPTCRCGIASMLAAIALVAVATARAEEAANHHHHHHQMMVNAPLTKSEARYEIPDVAMVDSTGRRVSLRSLLSGDGPVMLNFIYTSCTSICPAMSGVFAQVQRQLERDGQSVRMVSISIDPEYDTPARLAAYASNYSAGPGWIMLTGRLEDSLKVQRAFDSYRGDKMNHVPSTFIRVGRDRPWERVDGLASPGELIDEYRRITRRPLASASD